MTFFTFITFIYYYFSFVYFYLTYSLLFLKKNKPYIRNISMSKEELHVPRLHRQGQRSQ